MLNNFVFPVKNDHSIRTHHKICNNTYIITMCCVRSFHQLQFLWTLQVFNYYLLFMACMPHWSEHILYILNLSSKKHHFWIILFIRNNQMKDSTVECVKWGDKRRRCVESALLSTFCIYCIHTVQRVRWKLATTM